ncbi:MAG: hypothetical protein JOZ96_01815 [Acidobacteria bacterium]|nr:hypothetical protein [Acidobacteriota bacterium]
MFAIMFSGSSTAAGRPLEAAGTQQKVEVTYEQQQGGGEVVALKYLTWTEGLGWCCQKTIRVGGEQLEELHRAVTVARHRYRRQRAEAGEPTAPAQVIQLPSLS